MAYTKEILTLAAVAAVAWFLVRCFQKNTYFRRLELAIPGPPSLPLLGNALAFVTATPDSVWSTLQRLRGSRPLSRFTIFNKLFVMVSDPVQLREVISRREFDDKAHFYYSLIHFAAGKGVFHNNGAQWLAHRKWLRPAFQRSILDSFVSVFSEEAKGFVAHVPVGEDVELSELLERLAMRNFLRTQVSGDSSTMSHDAVSFCVDFLRMFVHSVNLRSFNPLLWSDQVFARTSVGRKLADMMSHANELFQSVLRARQAALASDKSQGMVGQARRTLDVLLSQSPIGAQMQDDDLLDELKTLFAANVETSVSALTWMLKVLSLLPEVQDRVHAEVCSVVGDRDITVDDLPLLEYVERVVKECLRMFPPVVVTARQCHAETNLCGHTIPAGTTVLLDIFSIHRDPKHWVRPECFDPDRFLPENSQGRYPYAFVPFSMGPRNCIGQKYAMMNMTTFLATTLRACKLLPTGDHEDLQSLADNVAFDMTSRLVGGARVRFQSRSM